MDKHDRDALEQALAMCRKESPERDAQLTAKLKDESWEDVASFAAFCRQGETLNLFPWQCPPCAVSEDGDRRAHNDPDAVQLLRKMLAAGVSRFDPDPLAALDHKGD